MNLNQDTHVVKGGVMKKPSAIDRILLGARIRQARMEMDWTQDKLDKEIGVSNGFVSSLERGLVAFKEQAKWSAAQKAISILKVEIPYVGERQGPIVRLPKAKKEDIPAQTFDQETQVIGLCNLALCSLKGKDQRLRVLAYLNERHSKQDAPPQLLEDHTSK